MEMVRRDYISKLAQTQSSVAAVLTPDQVVQVGGLLQVVRLQTFVTQAQCVSMEPQQEFLAAVPAERLAPTLQTCRPIPIPPGLVTYFNLTDVQVSTVESALKANQDYMNRQSVAIHELEYQIQDLTAVSTIDTQALGADYVRLAQIQRDDSAQANQLVTTVRSVITDQQQPLLEALDNAMNLAFTADEAITANILVLPPDLMSNCGSIFVSPFSSSVCSNVYYAPLLSSVPRYTGHGTK